MRGCGKLQLQLSVIGAACNSSHVVYDRDCQSLPIPWISIMDAVAEQVCKKNQRTVGLLGTVFTVGSDFYQKVFEKQDLLY